MEVEITKRGKKLDIQEIESFEKENNLTFPEDYKNFLLKYNGGYVWPGYYICPNEEGFGKNVFTEENSRIQCYDKELEDYLVKIIKFYPLYKGNIDSLSLYFPDEITKEVKKQMKNLFKIGENIYVDYFLISLREKDKGNIFYLDGYGNLYRISESFSDFFNNLQEDPTVTDFEKYCEKNDIEAIKILLDDGLDVNSRENSIGYSLLHYALFETKIEVVKLLLERGADFKKAFWYAYENTELFELLLSYGADINYKTGSGNPVFRAVKDNNPVLLKLFIEYGADLTVKDDRGKIPLDVAIDICKQSKLNPDTDEIVQILREAMK